MHVMKHHMEVIEQVECSNGKVLGIVVIFRFMINILITPFICYLYVTGRNYNPI